MLTRRPASHCPSELMALHSDGRATDPRRRTDGRTDSDRAAPAQAAPAACSLRPAATATHWLARLSAHGVQSSPCSHAHRPDSACRDPQTTAWRRRRVEGLAEDSRDTTAVSSRLIVAGHSLRLRVSASARRRHRPLPPSCRLCSAARHDRPTERSDGCALHQNCLSDDFVLISVSN